MPPVRIAQPHPMASAATIAGIAGQPFVADSTPITAAAKADSGPAERSTSPSSSTITEPKAMVAMPAICRIRLLIFRGVRNASLFNAKKVPMSSRPTTTGQHPEVTVA